MKPPPPARTFYGPQLAQGAARRQRRGAGLFAAFALFLGGCASTHYEIRVNASAPVQTARTGTYRIVDRVVPPQHALLYQDAAKIVRRAFAAKGMREATDGTEPDVLIVFGCGIGPATTRRTTVSQPVFLLVVGRVSYQRIQVGYTARGDPIYKEVPVQEPMRDEFAGVRTYPVDVKVFKKQLRLRAFENKDAADQVTPVEAWSVDATCEGEGQEIRQVLPALAAACMVYAGKNLPHPETIRLKDTDRNVAAITASR